MPESPESLAERLRVLTGAGVRSQLVAKGLARGMIWRDGNLPEGSPPTLRNLRSEDLLDHGYAILSMALRLRDTRQPPPEILENSFRVAAEAIESAVRRGPADNTMRDFHLAIAAAAFHIGHFAARSYCLIGSDYNHLNLSSSERALAILIRRSLGQLRSLCLNWLSDNRNSDDMVAELLLHDDNYEVEDALLTALNRNFYQALALFEFGLQHGDSSRVDDARRLLNYGAQAAGEMRLVPSWWVNTVARHLIDDLWNQSLHQQLPKLPDVDGGETWNDLRMRYIAVLSSRKFSEIDLWPSQIPAAQRATNPADNLIVALPTSAGKTRIAEMTILRALASGKRVVYVTPLRALSAQIERTLARTFRPLGFSVSSLYGASGVAAVDIGTLESSKIVVATPEKLDFAIRQKASIIDDVGLVVLDEGHMIGIGTREIRYEIMIQRLLKRPDASDRRIVCLSAVFKSGEAFDDFTKWVRSDMPGEPIESKWRPTRQRSGYLEWHGTRGRLQLNVDGEEPYIPGFVKQQPAKSGRKNPFPQNPQELVIATAKALADDGHRVLIYCPIKPSVESLARLCLKLNRQGYLQRFLRNEDRPRISRALAIGQEYLGLEHVAVKALDLGIAVHHGSLPRHFLAEVEALLDKKVLHLAIASPTLAQGLDLSCSALVFSSIYRNRMVIPADEYANVIGRVGRAFVDLDGLSLYPIYERGRKGGVKLRNYLDLQEETREMESGILELIDQIIKVLAERIGGSPEEAREYICNQTGPWFSDLNVDEGDAGEGETETEGDSDRLEHLVSDLDIAIIGMVDPNNSPNQLADALDSALRGSLWSRRLQRQSLVKRELQNEVLYKRGHWIWANSSASQRKGFFAAGVGYSAGSFIDTNLDSLFVDLARAETAQSEQHLEELIQSVGNLADKLLRVHPFAFKPLPNSWRDILAGWIRGTALGELGVDSDRSIVEFIQRGIVYQLVWGVEAVRVHGLAKGMEGSEFLSGSTGMILTYGVPVLEAASLMRAGLPSRRMALKLVIEYQPRSTDLLVWLPGVIDDLDQRDFWPDAETVSIWKDFVAGWRKTVNSTWSWAWYRFQCRWSASGLAPSPGSLVQLVHDPSRNMTYVCEPDLSILGELIEPFIEVEGRYIIAKVDDPPDAILAHCFGPKLVGRDGRAPGVGPS